jgi:hypothetical protein
MPAFATADALSFAFSACTSASSLRSTACAHRGHARIKSSTERSYRCCERSVALRWSKTVVKAARFASLSGDAARGRSRSAGFH